MASFLCRVPNASFSITSTNRRRTFYHQCSTITYFVYDCGSNSSSCNRENDLCRYRLALRTCTTFCDCSWRSRLVAPQMGCKLIDVFTWSKDDYGRSSAFRKNDRFHIHIQRRSASLPICKGEMGSPSWDAF